MIEDISIGKEIIFGVFIGILFIVLNATFGFVIGIPLIAVPSETEKLITIGGIAPVMEELGFRVVLPFILLTIGLPFIVVGIIDIISFALFHFAAYGASLTAAPLLFIGAGIFAIVAYLTTYRDGNTEDIHIPIASILGHSIVNFWLYAKASGLVVTSGIF